MFRTNLRWKEPLFPGEHYDRLAVLRSQVKHGQLYKTTLVLCIAFVTDLSLKAKGYHIPSFLKAEDLNVILSSLLVTFYLCSTLYACFLIFKGFLCKPRLSLSVIVWQGANGIVWTLAKVTVANMFSWNLWFCVKKKKNSISLKPLDEFECTSRFRINIPLIPLCTIHLSCSSNLLSCAHHNISSSTSSPFSSSSSSCSGDCWARQTH